jgi:hypothetical protein
MFQITKINEINETNAIFKRIIFFLVDWRRLFKDSKIQRFKIQRFKDSKIQGLASLSSLRSVQGFKDSTI